MWSPRPSRQPGKRQDRFTDDRPRGASPSFGARLLIDVLADDRQRDFGQAMKNFCSGTHGKPAWRKKGSHEGFRIVNFKPEHVNRLNRKNGEVFVPKIG